jgi:hypothetical protein
MAAERAGSGLPAGRWLPCLFCGAPHPTRDAARPSAVCLACGSPVCVAERHQHNETSLRTLDRMPRRLLMSFFLDWPARQVWTSLTEDVSINGLRFSSEIELRAGRRLRVDCAFCSAVAEVRHARRVPYSRPAVWDVGVEFLTLRLRASRGVFVSRGA